MGWPISQLEEHGFAIIENIIAPKVVEELRCELTTLPDDSATRTRRGEAFGRRNLMQLDCIRELADSEVLRGITWRVFGRDSQPVRGILFDKTPAANWTVPWHQDLSIAVATRLDVPGYGPWSNKAGVTHVQPSIDVLRQMITVRVHLDDCDQQNGPLRIIPGSHRKLLTADEMLRLAEDGPQIDCTVRAGGVIVMRPLILHASSPAKSPQHRRVIHIEFASCNLDGGLRWHSMVNKGTQA